MSNKKMEEKPPRGNGTVCTLISVKSRMGQNLMYGMTFMEKW
jgi:hypothetical protein